MPCSECPEPPSNAVKFVKSHPEALAQAERTLAGLGIRPVPRHDTAGAVREVAADGNREIAALGPPEAGPPHHLEVIRKNVMDRDHNTTRFFVLAKGATEVDPDDDKTSIMFVTAHRPGALALALTELGLRGANLTRIESRPSDEAWSYRFFVDLRSSPGTCRAAAGPRTRAGDTGSSARTRLVSGAPGLIID